MVLARILKNALVPQAPASVSTQNSAIALSTSANAMKALQRSGKEDLRTINSLAVAIEKPGNIDQGKSNNFGAQAGKISQRYHALKSIEKPFNAAMDDAVKGAELRSKMAEKAAKSGQKIAEMDAKTQAAIGWGHQEAAANVAYYSNAYGGSGFSV